MNMGSAQAEALWADALTTLELLALHPHRLGGIWLRAPYGPVRDAWLKALDAVPLPQLKVPGSVDTSRWLGGLDLAATLHTGSLCEQPGLLRQADQGLMCLPMAERFDAALAATLAQTLDRGGVNNGSGFHASRFGVVALDESEADEAALAPALQERLALWVDLRALPPAVLQARPGSASSSVSKPTTRTPSARGAAQTPLQAGAPAPGARSAERQDPYTVVAGDSALQALCGTAWAMGIDSLRIPQLALQVARSHAALHGRDHVADEDLGFACRTVLGPRARQVPTQMSEEEPADEEETQEALPPDTPPLEAGAGDPPPPPTPDTPPPEAPETPTEPPSAETVEALQATMVAAAAARLPPDLLQRLATGAAPLRSAAQGGTSGQRLMGRQRGRPLPPRPGRPGPGARLHLLATLRAAAPRQRLRGRSSPDQPLRLRSEDFHIHRHQQHAPSCLILALDASGSAALHRLAEAKGAVQLLLEQSYARRDSVCVIGFRAAQAQCLLPMTRSLVRARRALSGLPGGGGTPLASALQMAHGQARQMQRQGVTPILVVLSDGRANVTLQGLGGRVQAQEEARHWARAWQQLGHAGLWIDTAPQPEAQAQQLASLLGARYLPMPAVQSRRLAQALQDARPGG